MMQFTEEQRKALAGLCNIEIKRWKVASEANPNMRYMVELMEIALAALAAPPVAALTLPTLRLLIESEVSDFCAGIGSPGEPETPEEIQADLMGRIAAVFRDPLPAAMNATAPAVPDGWKIVPVEPTPEMISAGKGGCVTSYMAREIYDDMLAAAPSPSDHL
ncbi:hypothetical protein [Pantoea latae]|uniref:hypothetical protein n=1 Tax=Pantoea latae TaxID=1964541 RepID=UPI001F17A8E2|nr:hypothetical protein [Pantoea latae]